MCSAGGPPDIQFDLDGEEYRCNDCGETFKALDKPICPHCKSKNASPA